MDAYNTDEIYHHGVKGMQHGVRRYQDKNGGWTPLGAKLKALREGYTFHKQQKAEKKQANYIRKQAIKTAKLRKKTERQQAKAQAIAQKQALKNAKMQVKAEKRAAKTAKKQYKEYMHSPEHNSQKKDERLMAAYRKAYDKNDKRGMQKVVRQMSSGQLEQLTNRLNAESKVYSAYDNSPAGRDAKARKETIGKIENAVLDTGLSVGKDVAKAYATQYAKESLGLGNRTNRLKLAYKNKNVTDKDIANAVKQDKKRDAQKAKTDISNQKAKRRENVMNVVTKFSDLRTKLKKNSNERKASDDELATSMMENANKRRSILKKKASEVPKKEEKKETVVDGDIVKQKSSPKKESTPKSKGPVSTPKKQTKTSSNEPTFISDAFKKRKSQSQQKDIPKQESKKPKYDERLDKLIPKGFTYDGTGVKDPRKTAKSSSKAYSEAIKNAQKQKKKNDKISKKLDDQTSSILADNQKKLDALRKRRRR